MKNRALFLSLCLLALSAQVIHAQSTTVKFYLNMNGQVDLGNFTIGTDSVDVAANYNGWGSPPDTLVHEGNGIYSVTYVDSFAIGDTLEYRFRVNHSWGTAEFPGGQPERVYIVQSFNDTVHHFYDDYIINAAMPAYFPFDGSASDASGSGNDPAFNSATLDADRFGRPDSSFYFDGVDDYIRYGPGLGLINDTNYFTISAWVYLDQLNPGQNTILGERGSGDNYQLAITDGALSFSYWSSGMESVVTGAEGRFNRNEWFHVAVAGEGFGISMYVDGQLVSAAPISGNIDNNPSSLYIGTWDGSSDMLNGRVDEIRFYDRGLSSEEIQTLFGLKDFSKKSKDYITDDELSGDARWTSDKTYVLDGMVYLESGTLTIEPGTVIKARENPTTGDNTSCLVITRGARIQAAGNANNPVIFTSEHDDLGDPWDLDHNSTGLWGGIYIMGSATITSSGDSLLMDGFGDERGYFGGYDDSHDAGSLSYVSIRFGGAQLDTDMEANGLTLAGVGDAATIDHVEVFAAGDDGIEILGGTVDLKYMVSAFNRDDCFDYTMGWRGSGQFWFALQAGEQADNALEADGAVPPEELPFSDPGLANLSLIGSGIGSTADNPRALHLKGATGGDIINSLITGFPRYGIEVEDLPAGPADARQRMEDGDLALSGNIWYDFGNGDAFSAGNIIRASDEAEDATAQFLVDHLNANGNTTGNPQINSISRTQTPSLDPRIAPGSPAYSGLSPYPADPFFDEVSFKGAFDTINNWISGWTALSGMNYLGPVSNDLTVIAIHPPGKGNQCGLTDNETVTFEIYNRGQSAQDAYDLSYSINGGSTWNTVAVNTHVEPEGSVMFDVIGLDLSVFGSIEIMGATLLAGDENPGNDTLKSVFVYNKPLISTFPYEQDFEAGDGYWTVEGQNPSWELGTPAGDVITGAASGSNAWMTGLSGQCNPNEKSWVESPCFDFSGLTTPVIQFRIWYYMNYYAAATIQYSTDGGSSWNAIGSQHDYLNWYNYGSGALDYTGTSNNGWMGYGKGWVLARHTLDGLGGEPSVRFRVAFGSYPSGDPLEGFAFDDVSIMELPSQEAGITGIYAPGNSCILSSYENLEIEITNYGANTITDIQYWIQLNDDPPDLMSIPGANLLPGQSNYFFHDTAYDLSADSTSYQFKFWIDVAGDPFPDNDTLVEVIEHLPYITGFPYFEDFEGPDHFWTTGQLTQTYNSSWELGEPAGSIINDPGNNAWVTNPSGAYNFLEYSYIESPCFDLSDMEAILEFKIRRDLSENFSGHVYVTAEMDDEGGFDLLGDVGDYLNWYNEGGRGTLSYGDYDAGWAAVRDDDWITVRHVLPYPYSATRIRIHFESMDNWDFSEGVAIDDVKIYEKPDFDLRMYQWISPVSGPDMESDEQVYIRIVNEGQMETIDNIILSYSIDGGSTWKDDTIPGGLFYPGDTLYHYFSNADDLADFSAYGQYHCLAAVSYPDDTLITDNDTLSLTIINSPLISSLPYWQDFEGTHYWTAGGKNSSWETGAPAGAVIDHAWSGTNAWVTNLTGNYNPSEQSWVEGPYFNFSFIAHPVIRLWKWSETRGNAGATFQYSVDSGMTWQQVGSIGTGDNWFNTGVGALGFLGNNEGWNQSNGDWLMAGHNLNFLFGQPKVKFRFVFGSCIINDTEGFGFDDILVYDASFDGTVTELLYPSSGCGLGSAEQLQVRLQNMGVYDWSSDFYVYYQINGGAIRKDTIYFFVGPGETYDHTFLNDPADLSLPGTYNIKIWTGIPGDGYPYNDTLQVTIENKPIISAFPYYQGFEGTHYWTHGGSNSSWQLGSPNGNVIDHTAGGMNAWTTNLIGPYNQGEQSWVEGPCFDFTGLSNPVIRFKAWTHTNPEAGAALQHSDDGGITWWNVGTQGDQVNWYTGYVSALEALAGGDGWMGLYGDYWSVVYDLGFLSYMPDVRFRIAFASEEGAGNMYDGFAFDDVMIYDRPAADAFMAHLNGPATGCGIDNRIDVKILNAGKEFIDSVTINYQVNAEPPDSFVFHTSIMPGSIGATSFTVQDYFTAPGEYMIRVWSSLAGDMNTWNDSLYRMIVNQPLVSEKPYFQDFENDTHYWAPVFDSYAGNEIFYPNGEDYPPGWSLDTPDGSVINSAASGSSAWYTSNTFYDISYVVSPCFDLSSYTRPVIEFSMWRQLAGMNMGVGLQYSLDGGGSWDYVGYTGDTLNWYTDPGEDLWVMSHWGEPIGWNESRDAGWVTASHVLEGLGGQENVILRFVSHLNDNWDMLDGFAFDDVTIYDLLAAEDAALTAILAPSPACEYSASETVEVEIRNDGTGSISSFPVYYRLNTDAPHSEIYTGTLAAGETGIFTFSVPVDLSAINMHELTVWVDHPGDPFGDNDTLRTSVPSFPVVSSFPYLEDFEGIHYWMSHGDNSSWEAGTPSGSTINSAASGSTAWATNLGGQYGDYEQGHVGSPCIDLSGLANPVLEMNVWTDCGDADDGAYLEYSLDNGNSWNLLGDSYDTEWYNHESDPGQNGPARLGILHYWTLQSFMWYGVKHSLAEIAGEPNVRLRVSFASDEGDNSEGIAFDDVHIYDDVQPIPWDTRGINVDGLPDDSLWMAAPVVAIDGTGQEGPSDLSASWKAAWDAENIYILVEVTDDTLYNGAGEGSKNNDNVEVYFDLLNNRDGSGYWSDDNRQLRFICPMGDAYGNDGDIQGLEFANSAGTGNYRFEIRIPWAGLLERGGISIPLKTGTAIGFDVAVTDNDDPAVETVLSWRNAVWTNLDGAGTIVLEGRPPVLADAGVAEILEPVFAQPVCQPAPRDVTIRVVNDGDQAISDFDVSFEVDSIQQGLETITDTIWPGDTLTHTFAVQADLYTTDYYRVSTLAARTLLAGDETSLNDSRSVQIMIYGDHTSPPGWTLYSPCDYGNDPQVTGVTEDTAGNIWIGTNNGGAMMFDGVTFVTYDTTNSGIAANDVEVIYADQAGNLLVGHWMNDEGLSFYDGATWTNYTTFNSGLANNIVESLLEKDGLYYIGTAGGGVSVFNGTSFDVTYSTANSDIISDYVYDLDTDTSGNIWIATEFGVSMFDGASFTSYDAVTIGCSGSSVFRLRVDDSNNVWIGTYGAGVFVFDGVGWTNYNTSNSGLSLDEVLSLGLDNQGNIWIGTFGAGYDRFDGSAWTNFSTGNVMPDNHSWQNVLTASDGRLWFPTYRGLAVFDPAVEQHAIDLLAGWNIFSTYLQPGDPDMGAILHGLTGADKLIKVQDETGASVDSVPGVGWVNSIGTLQYTEGYKIKVKADTQLVISGIPLALPAPVGLVTGWNIISYPAEEPENAGTVLDPLVVAGQLVKVQDETGAAFEEVPPIGWIDNIGDFMPGEGYKVRVNTNTSLTVSEPVTKSGVITRPAFLKADYFKPAYSGNGLDHMNLYVVTPAIDGLAMQPGDEIAVYDGDVCAGAVRIGDSHAEYISLRASRDDPTTGETDGYLPGNLISFRVWDASRQMLIENPEPTYYRGYPDRFRASGTTLLGMNASSTGMAALSGLTTGLGDNYPNPFGRETTIGYSLAARMKVTITVYDLLGRKIRILLDETMPAGVHKVLWDRGDDGGNEVSRGIYLYEMKTGNYRAVRQMSVVY